MDHRKDLHLSFPIGKNSGSCGKAEAMEEFWSRCSEQRPEIIVIDPTREEAGMLDALKMDTQSSHFSTIHSCPKMKHDNDN